LNRTIEVSANTSPLVRLHLQGNDANGEPYPFDLMGANPIRFIIKASPDSPDPAPTYAYPGGGITIMDVAGGLVAVQFQAADIPSPGNRAYLVNVHKGSLITTMLWGRLAIL
jgi:hypothetical protein